MNATPSQRAARRLKEWRESRDLDQREVAARLSRDQPWVSRSERTGPALDDLDDLAELTGHPVEDFVTLSPVSFRPEKESAQSDQPGAIPAMSSSVILPPQTEDAPGEDRAVFFPRSFPMSPAHVVLYGFIGTLAEDQARKLWQPLLHLVEQSTQPETPTSDPTKTQHGKKPTK